MDDCRNSEEEEIITSAGDCFKTGKQGLQNILGFHAFTGCNVTSPLFGYSKNTCGKIFKDFPDLLYRVGRDQYDGIQEYVCRLCSALDFTAGVKKARSDLFSKGNKELEKLPPILESCLQLIFCGCKSKCRTAACKCYKSEQVCTPLCVCNADGCLNLHSGDTDEYMDHTTVDTDEFMSRTG